jgi:hypothetical protein
LGARPLGQGCLAPRSRPLGASSAPSRGGKGRAVALTVWWGGVFLYGPTSPNFAAEGTNAASL